MNLLWRQCLLKAQRAFNGFDSMVKNGHRFDGSDYPAPIFIVGAPRTGSTLLFQTMLRQFKAAHISNLMALAPSQMIKIAIICKRMGYLYTRGVKESTFGYVPGIQSPNEAGLIAETWFGRSLSETDTSRVRRTFNALSEIFYGPVVMKNMINSLRLKFVRSVLPECRFIYLKRNPLYTAQSIILVRRKFLGDDALWWSTKPPGYETTLDHDPCYQVIWQVVSIEKIIEDALKAVPELIYVIDYDEFRQNPADTIDALATKFSIELRPDGLTDYVFIRSGNNIRLEADEWEKLEHYYGELSS